MTTISSVAASLTSGSSTKSKVYASGTGGKVFAFELYKRTVVNALKPAPEEAPHIGYLDKNKSALEVQSTLTRQNTENYFSFRFRKGETIKLDVDMNKGVRVQLYDPSGKHLLADSEGKTAVSLSNYKKLTEGTLELKTGDYLIKTSYTASAYKNKTLNYDLTLMSGTTYQSKYKTMAQSTTVYNTLLEGKSIGGFNPKTTAASVLSAAQSGEETNIFDFYT